MRNNSSLINSQKSLTSIKSLCSVNVILIDTILYQYSKLYSNFILNYTLSSLDYSCAFGFGVRCRLHGMALGKIILTMGKKFSQWVKSFSKEWEVLATNMKILTNSFPKKT